MGSSESGSVWGSRWVRVGGVGLGALVAGALAIFIGVRVLYDAEYVEARLNRALDSTSAHPFRVEVGGVQWGLWLSSVQMDRVVLRRDSSVSEVATAEKPPRRATLATVPVLTVDGIRLWPLLWSRLTVSTVRVQGPRVRLPEVEEVERLVKPSGVRDSLRSGPSSSTINPNEAPPVSIQKIEVRDGTMSVSRPDAPADSAWGLSVTVDRKRPRPVKSFVPAALLGAETRVTFDGYRRVFADRLYAFRLGPGRFAPPDSTLRVDALSFAPIVSDSVWMHRHEVRANRYVVKIGRVEARGANFHRFLEDGALLAEAVRVKAGTLDVYRDNHRPPAPEDPPQALPNEAVRSLDRRVRVDTVRVIQSDIRYAKRKAQVPKPGSISFENLWATVYNVTNDPDRMTRSAPAVVEAQTDVAGAGRLQTIMRLPLLASGVTLSYEGQLGAMDARAFNDTFVNLAGVRIEHGQVDSLWFEAEVSDGVATGSVHGIYRNLEIETLDPTRGGRGLKNRLKTVVVNGLGLRSKVVPGDGPLRRGTIQYEYREDMTVFKFLWKSLRSGIYSLVGLDRLRR